MENLTEHRLIKTSTGYKCNACQQIWKGKPRNKNCAGVPIIKMRKAELERLKLTHWKYQKYWLKNSLNRENLRPTTKVACVKQGKNYIYLYDPQGETEKIDPHLPPVVKLESCNRTTECKSETHCLKSEIGLRKLNLIPGDAKPTAVYWHYTKFVPLYNPLDCQIYIKDFPKVLDTYEGYESKLLHHKQRQALNLKVKAGEKPLFAYWNYNEDWELLYSRSSCEINDLSLPPVITDTSNSFYQGDLLSDRALQLLNLKPRQGMKAVACYWERDSWVLLWDIKQCQQIDTFLPSAVREIPRGWYKADELRRFNRMPDNPVGTIFDFKEDKFILLYRPNDCSIADSSLPPVYKNIPSHLCKKENLAKQNRELTEEIQPRGIIWEEYLQKFTYLYKPEECKVKNPYLPPIVSYSGDFDRSYESSWNYSKFCNALKSKVGLKRLNLTTGKIEPIAVYWNHSNFEPLYNPLDCQIRIKDLPSIISDRETAAYADRNFTHSDLLDEAKLKNLNLKPRDNTIAVAVCWNAKIEDWDYLWDIKQCQVKNISLPPVYPEKPPNLYLATELARLNRTLCPQVKPVACIRVYDEYSLLYDADDCPLIDSSLPPCYDKDRLPTRLKSKWAWQQSEPLFDLKENAIPKGCFLLPEPRNKYKPVLLYDRSSLKLHYREVYLSKNQAQAKLSLFFQIPQAFRRTR